MNIFHGAISVLNTANPQEKAVRAREITRRWNARPSYDSVKDAPPDTPARPAKPQLVPPNEVPRRRLGSPAGRAALLHAVAHIEFNAIDLAADMIARFGKHPLITASERADFLTDWLCVLDDEARHFELINNRLKGMKFAYGDLPAHNGLWEAATATKDHFAARLAIAPMVLEARGLDVTLQMIDKLRRFEDHESADVLQIIYEDEIGHVAIGSKWFHYIAQKEGQNAENYFKMLVKTYFKGQLKPPFNHIARNKAGMPKNYYACEGNLS